MEKKCPRSWRWVPELVEAGTWGKVSPRCKSVLEQQTLNFINIYSYYGNEKTKTLALKKPLKKRKKSGEKTPVKKAPKKAAKKAVKKHLLKKPLKSHKKKPRQGNEKSCEKTPVKKLRQKRQQ